jgi:CheY-like chemotaxis protein/nitrogen-specific signal transduction histidine kinase
MSHEIRTPLNAIIGMSAIGEAAPNNERKNEAFSKIHDASNHLLGVINDVLDMSKIEMNKMELSAVDFEFSRLINTAADLISFRATEKRQTLLTDIDPAIPPVLYGDDQRLSQVLMNLLGNAVKFTPEDGTVSITVRLLEGAEAADAIEAIEAERRAAETDENGVDGADTGIDTGETIEGGGALGAEPDKLNTLRVDIIDTGIGITPEQQTRLFTPFQQAENSTTRRFGGSGLGLVISKKIVELMGGMIWVESEPGKGSTFSFIIRLATGHADKDLTDSIRNPGGFSGETRIGDRRDELKDYHILLVEDVDVNREIVHALLDPTGLAIDDAENGNEGVRAFSEAPERYDLILMDVQMPEMDGYEATKHIRALDTPRAQSVPIVAMTANVFREDVEKSLAAGMNDHLGKPLDFDEVFRKLKQYLGPRP